MENRREFLKHASVSLLLITTGVACGGGGGAGGAAGAGGSAGAGGATGHGSGPCEGLDPTSSVAYGHTHNVCVETSVLTSPPSAGVSLTTTIAQGHDHMVTLTQAQLQLIESGKEVDVPTSVSSGHKHEFFIVKKAA